MEHHTQEGCLMDYAANLYDPVYGVLGVAAVFTTPGTEGVEVDLTALDKTSGIVAAAGAGRFQSDVLTIEPAAAVRYAELSAKIESLDLDALRGSSLLMNGKTWKVRAHELRPAPTGEAQGEVLFLLTELD